MSDFAGLAVDACFEMFGDDAFYVAPNGGPELPCRVLLDLRDPSQRDEVGEPPAGTATIEVRASEIVKPVVRGVFKVGSVRYEVRSRPRMTDPRGLVWTMWIDLP